MSQTLIVVGATGFIGRNLCRLAGRRGFEVIGVVRQMQQVEGCSHMLSLAELDGFLSAPGKTVLCHVGAARYHAACFQETQVEAMNVNVALANEVYAFCARAGIKEVRLASSSAVYAAGMDVMDDAEPIDLNRPPHKGENLYAWSKRWAEMLSQLYAERFGINTIAFRLSNPYGPFDSTDLSAAHVAPAFAMKALADTTEFEILGNPEAQRDFIYAGDVANVFLQSTDWRGRHDVFNLCSGETSTLRDLAQAALKAAGANKPITVTGAPGGVAVRRLTAQRLREAFSIDQFTPLLEGMRQTVEWYRHALR